LAAKNGLDVLAGVIDSDYRGEICCILYNTGDAVISLKAGSKICQLILEKIITPEAAWVVDLDETARGAGGFGSTD
jgi:dUTP pyrophosphatase